MNAFAKFEQVLSIGLPRNLRKDVVREVMDGLHAEFDDAKSQHGELGTDDLMELVLLKRQPPHILAAEYRSQYYSEDNAAEQTAIRAVLGVSVGCAILFTLSALMFVFIPESDLSIRLTVLVVAAICAIVSSSLMIMNLAGKLVPALVRFRGIPVAVGRIMWIQFQKAEGGSHRPNESIRNTSHLFAWAGSEFYVLARVTMAIVVLLVLLFAPRLFGLYIFSGGTGVQLAVYPVLTQEFLHISRPLVAVWLVVLAIGTGISGFSKHREIAVVSRVITKSIGVCIGMTVLVIGNIFGKPEDISDSLPMNIKTILDSIAPYVFDGLVLLCWIGVIALFLSLLRDVFKLYYRDEFKLTF